MDHLEFQGLPQDTHHCTSHRDGDWITWRCPECAGYERKFNWKTGEMNVRSGDSKFLHTGASTKSQNMEALSRISNIRLQ